MHKSTLHSYNQFANIWQYQQDNNLKFVHKFIEKPYIQSLLESEQIINKNILCLGSGTGEETKYFLSKGAKNVIGIEISKSMYEISEKSLTEKEKSVVKFFNFDFTNELEISKICENINIEHFDFIYSSMSLHYEKNLNIVFSNLKKISKPDTKIIFSINHPLWVTFNQNKKKENNKINFEIGYEKNLITKEINNKGNYFDKNLIEDTWYNGKFEYKYYKHNIEDISTYLFKNNFLIENIIEAHLNIAFLKKLNLLKDIKESELKAKAAYQYFPSILIMKALFR